MVGLLLAATVSMAVSIFGTRFLIDALRARRVGQPIREEGPQGHQTKAGTPTMGGIAIVGAAVAGYVVAHFREGVIFTYSGLFLMAAMIGAGLVGFADDLIKVRNERNLGLNKRTKMVGLLVVAIGFAVLAVQLAPVHTTLSFTRFSSPGIELGKVGWCIVVVLMVIGSANAVNLTDGLDGLAAGSAIYAFVCYTVIAFWGFRHTGGTGANDIYHLVHAYDLAVCAAAMLGACVGFLWWNANPAKIFMGDTGSLAIGTAVAGLAALTSTQLLLPIVGGLFVIEALSVMIQVTSFRVFGGRRVFRMAPIHHHFELSGWPETTVIVRFWILAMVCAALALGFFYADFLSIGGID